MGADGLPAWIDRDLEARKHLWKGLQRLTPAGRVRFLEAVARSAVKFAGVETRVTSHTGTVHEAYLDLMTLAATHGADLGLACAELERWLKKGG